MSDMDKLDGLAGTLLSSTASFAALMMMLRRKGVLTDQEEREVYETALLLLKTSKGDDSETNHIYELARDVIETQLMAEP